MAGVLGASMAVFLVSMDGTMRFAAFGALRAVTPVAALSGRFASKHGHRPVLLAGCLVYAASGIWFLCVPGTEPAYLTHWLPGLLLSGIGVGMVMPSLSGAAVSRIPADQFAIGSAINQAVRQIGSVMGVALTVWLLSGASWQRVDFNTVYLCHASLALLTAAFCLPVNTSPSAIARKSWS